MGFLQNWRAFPLLGKHVEIIKIKQFLTLIPHHIFHITNHEGSFQNYAYSPFKLDWQFFMRWRLRLRTNENSRTLRKCLQPVKDWKLFIFVQKVLLSFLSNSWVLCLCVISVHWVYVSTLYFTTKLVKYKIFTVSQFLQIFNKCTLFMYRVSQKVFNYLKYLVFTIQSWTPINKNAPQYE